MRCKNCKREVDSDTLFCPYCGSRMENKHSSNEKRKNTTNIEIIAMIMGVVIFLIAAGFFVFLFMGNSNSGGRKDKSDGTATIRHTEATEKSTERMTDSEYLTETATSVETTVPTETRAQTESTAPAETRAQTESTAPTETTASKETEKYSNGKVVVIDPGHQEKENSDREPEGPGAGNSYEDTSKKMTTGATGCISGMTEYELNLEVALKLQKELENRGYKVIMTRTTNNVDISNAERAEMANQINADAFIRIHGNSSTKDSSQSGVMTICQSPANPYNAYLYDECHRLSQYILDSLADATGASKHKIREDDEMVGINWSEVPVSIVEIGYMTNPAEDVLMTTDDYQYKLADGIANGIDKFLNIQ